jgi:hypothetical protein
MRFDESFSQLVATVPSPENLRELCPPVSVYDWGNTVSVGAAHVDDAIWDIVVTSRFASGEDVTVNDGSTPQTSEGIAVGSPEADLTSAYPNAEHFDDPGRSKYGITNETGQWITFYVPYGFVESIHVSDKFAAPLEFCN